MVILIWTVLFCLGWRIITDEGQLLYSIRKLFEDIESDYDYHLEREKNFGEKINNYKKFTSKLLMFVGKPFVICITCMSSFWGCLIYWYMTTEFIIINMGINCICASFIQTFIWVLYSNKINK